MFYSDGTLGGHPIFDIVNFRLHANPRQSPLLVASSALTAVHKT
jgi:hypothetical protein